MILLPSHRLKTFIFISSLLLFSLLPNRAAADQVCQDYIPDNAPDSRYFDHKDGTISDSYTGLMWKQCVEGQSYTDSCVYGTNTDIWTDALEKADRSTFAGYTDWRVPNVTELQSLVRNRCYDPSINLTHFPRSSSENVWTSSANARNREPLVVNFKHGNIYDSSRSLTLRTRLVRSAF
jgi:hypothetical protein